MDIKKIVLAVALMLGMAAPAQAVNGLGLVKRILCIGGGTCSGLTSLGSGYTALTCFYGGSRFLSGAVEEAENSNSEAGAGVAVGAGVIGAGIAGVGGVLASGLAVSSGMLSGLLFYLGLKK